MRSCGVVERTAPAGRIVLAWQAALTCLAASTVWLVVDPLGGDQAAHAYLTKSLAGSGVSLWDNLWYGGRYAFVTYSLVYYPLAARVGERPVATASVLAASVGMALLFWRMAGRRARWAALIFAASVPFQLVIGQYPFALGAALAIWAGVAIAADRPLLATILALVSAAASPLAFGFLVLVVAGFALGSRQVRQGHAMRRAAIGLLATGAIVLLTIRAFPDAGRYPYTLFDLCRLLLFCGAVAVAVAADDPLRPILRAAAGLYAAAALMAFVVPTVLGSNLERLANYIALPLAAIIISRRRPRWAIATGVLVATSLSLQLTPAVDVLARSNDPSNQASFWQGATAYLAAHKNPNYRVEVVSTSTHWESYYLAERGIPLARGWFRQDDYPLNATLLNDDLTATAYRAWLSELAIDYVVVPKAPLDASAKAEAAIVEHDPAAAGLQRVWSDRDVTILSVTRPRPLVTGLASQPPARVVALDRSTVTIQASAPGPYLVRVRYTPYWTTSDPVCVRSAGTSGLTRIDVARAGSIQLKFAPSAETIAEQIIGRAGSSGCAGS
jgi:hypothetical protein